MRLSSKAVDKAGNLAAKDFSFNAVYGFGGFLAPIKSDGSGLYKQGRTLPVKFRLTDSNENFASTAIANLFLAKVSGGIAGTDEVTLSTSAADFGNQFRYDVADNQYIFNLSLDLDIGTWQLKVVLDDGKDYAVNISVRE